MAISDAERTGIYNAVQIGAEVYPLHDDGAEALRAWFRESFPSFGTTIAASENTRGHDDVLVIARQVIGGRSWR